MTGPQAEHRTDHDPVVAGTQARKSSLAAGSFCAGLAAVAILFLNSGRLEATPSLVTPSAAAARFEPPPPLDLPRPAPEPAPVVQQVIAPPPPPPPPPPAAPDDSAQRLHAPMVVVDLQSGRSSPMADAPAIPAAANLATKSESAQLAPSAADGTAPGAHVTSGPIEQFAARLGQQSADTALATQMNNLRTTLAQGSTVQALLETALNSDLPGYVRAVVRRDVLGFDGKEVLIPRGSRVIGQYRSAVSLGQSRVFVIWTRVIRPDGVTVQISSPGGDSLGGGGLTGEVNTHFFARFGGAILLSVLNAGVAAVSRAPTTQIAIGSPAAAAGAAAAATFPQGSEIAPTIKVEQGSLVTIFVARDLDFSAVKSVP